MIVDPRPYMIVKQLRTRDLRGTDIVLLPPVPNAWANPRWMRWGDLTVEQLNHFRTLDDGLTLVSVQVRETLGPLWHDLDAPPDEIEVDAYRDALRGQTP